MPNADTAHTPLMIPAVTPEMILGPGRRRVSRPGGVHAPGRPRSPMPRPNLSGTRSVATPVSDPGTVPAQAGPRFESAVPGRPDPERTAAAEGSSRKQHRFGLRELLDPVVRKAKKVKKVKENLRRKRPRR
ncbi:hypothetical protein SD37_17150 [Amycolatopsis orientalis]|uniref:Uncharacterized protein n=1 Tax=Amycolatopsis orientalis TaxID=31958 RepID=A0A193BYF4_AMYOR|nr:hypothetical protein SD37_17150 [Amycolatopsis orientalis]